PREGVAVPDGERRDGAQLPRLRAQALPGMARAGAVLLRGAADLAGPPAGRAGAGGGRGARVLAARLPLPGAGAGLRGAVDAAEGAAGRVLRRGSSPLTPAEPWPTGRNSPTVEGPRPNPQPRGTRRGGGDDA